MAVSARFAVLLIFPRDLIDALDTAAKAAGSSRSALIRRLLQEGLERSNADRNPSSQFVDSPRPADRG